MGSTLFGGLLTRYYILYRSLTLASRIHIIIRTHIASFLEITKFYNNISYILIFIKASSLRS